MSEEKEMIGRLRARAAERLQTIGHPPLSFRIKTGVKTMLGRGGGERDLLFWPAGFLLLGLSAGDGEAPEAEAWFSMWQNKSGAVRYLDDTLAGCAAQQIIKRHPSDGAAAAGVVKPIREFLKTAPRDPSGGFIYHPTATHRSVYADGIGMAVRFLAYDAMAGGEEAAASRELARTQIEAYFRCGMDARSGLPYHGFRVLSDGGTVRQGLVGWGRAVGFFLMGLSAYDVLPAAAGEEDIDNGYRELLKRTLSYQRLDGLFSWHLPAVDGHEDTSAGAMIGIALETALQQGRIAEDPVWKERLEEASDRLAAALTEHIDRDGNLTDSLAECVDFGQHPQQYGVYPWGLGAGLAFLEMRGCRDRR